MNLIYIHTHDSGRIMSPYGQKTPTPNIEKFSEDSLLFHNCYSVAPTCSPSRAALLTGTYPHQNGMLGLAQRGFSITDYSKHLVGFLNKNKYHTVLCGIQHEAGWYLDIGENSKTIGYKEEISDPTDGYKDEELTTWDKKNALSVCSWLKNYSGSKPFFLSYGMFATHRRYPDIAPDIKENTSVPPYPIPNNDKTRHDYARYLTSVKSADECFGIVMEALKESRHLDDTIVLFTTDHGVAYPFCKCSLFDSGIGVNLMMRVPGSCMNGHATDSLVSQIDVFPTLCDLLHLPKPDYLEGTSFAPVFNGARGDFRDEIFAESSFHTSYEPIRCVRTKRYKYIRYYDTSYLYINKSNIDESETKDFFMENGLDKHKKYAEALYDLYFDPGERDNLSCNSVYKAVLEDMRGRLEKHLEETDDFILKGPVTIDKNWKVNKKECYYASSRDPEDYVSLGGKF